MSKTYYSMNNPLMSEHQNLIDNSNSEEIPWAIESVDGMKAYIETQGGGTLFYPTTSIKDFVIADDAEMARVGSVIDDNASTVVLTKYQSVLKDIIGNDSITDMSIYIPLGLFYYADNLENGNEKYLEDKEVVFGISCIDDRDNREVKITIKEYPEEALEFNYQTARKLVLEAIKEGCPHAVNITTDAPC